MRIVNPSFGRTTSAEAPVAHAQSTDWRRDPIVLFSNSKPNTKELLDGLRQHLRAVRATDSIDFVYKDGAGQPAPAEIIDQVAGNYRGAILALAD